MFNWYEWVYWLKIPQKRILLKSSSYFSFKATLKLLSCFKTYILLKRQTVTSTNSQHTFKNLWLSLRKVTKRQLHDGNLKNHPELKPGIRAWDQFWIVLHYSHTYIHRHQEKREVWGDSVERSPCGSFMQIYPPCIACAPRSRLSEYSSLPFLVLPFFYHHTQPGRVASTKFWSL